MTRSLAGFSRSNRQRFFPGCSFPKLKFLSNFYCMLSYTRHLVRAFVSSTSPSGLLTLPGVGPRNRYCWILEWRRVWVAGTKLATPFAINFDNSTGCNSERRQRFLDFTSYLLSRYLIRPIECYHRSGLCDYIFNSYVSRQSSSHIWNVGCSFDSFV